MTNYNDIPKVGPAEFVRDGFPEWYQAEVKRLAALNQQIYQQAIQQADKTYQQSMEKFETIVALAQQLWGAQSAVVKYLAKHKPRRFADLSTPPNFQRRVNKVWRDYEAWLEGEMRRDREREYRQRRAQMNEFLQKLGYEPGEHYQPGRAITFAKQVVNPAQPQVRMLPGGEDS